MSSKGSPKNGTRSKRKGGGSSRQQQQQQQQQSEQVEQAQDLLVQQALDYERYHRQVANYTVLSRHDSCLARLLHTSSHCVVYEYSNSDSDGQQPLGWQKLGYQGVLFIYSREPSGDSPYPFGLMVLNRLNLDNFNIGICAVTNKTEIALEGEFVMIQITDNHNNGKAAIYGLWIFQEQDRMPVYQQLRQCLGDSYDMRSSCVPPSQTPQQVPANVSSNYQPTTNKIETLLQRAKNAYLQGQ